MDSLSQEFEKKCIVKPQICAPTPLHLPHPLNQSDFLHRFGVIIAGSFAVRHFFPNDNWIPGDLDIFMMDTPNGELSYDLMEALQKEGWTQNRTRVKKPGSFLYHFNFPKSHKFHMHHPSNNMEMEVICFAFQNRCVQEIVNSYFDIDGCTISWNGFQWNLTPKMDFNDFLSRKWKFMWNENNENEESCFTKMEFDRKNIYYTARGDIIGLSSAETIRHVNDRMRKYESRGFLIVNQQKIRASLFNMLMT